MIQATAWAPAARRQFPYRDNLLVGESPKHVQESIADNLKKAGWSLGWVSAVDSCGRTIFVADAYRGDGKRFVVRAEEKLTAFVELESALLAAASRSYPGAVNLTGDFWWASRIEIDEK